MTRASFVIAPIVRAILGAACDVESSELRRLPRKGPLIIVSNHINFLEAPLLYSLLYPREVAGFAKAETWRNPLLGFLASAWECVPVERGESDMASMRGALGILRRGKMLNIMPEGTRSHDGRLGRGHQGVVTIALRSGAPLVPVALYGSESFWSELKRGRRAKMRFRVGEAFRVLEPGRGEARTARAEAAEEIMLCLARLLPPEYRGAYADSAASGGGPGDWPFRRLAPLGARP